MPKIVAICNQKGGVGKTSTAVSLSSCLALNGKKTLLIDLDPQGNATSGVGVDKSQVQKSIYHSLLESVPLSEIISETCVSGLSIVPANQDLAGTEVELVGELGREGKLRKGLGAVDPAFDVVIIDCPPSFGLLTINALTAAHSVIIPIQCEYYALEGLGKLVGVMDQLRQGGINPTLAMCGLLMTMFDIRTNLSAAVMKDVRDHFQEVVFETVIPRSIRISEAPSFTQTVLEYDSKGPGALAYRALALEFLARQAQGLSFVGAPQ